jgi:uncharacterized BrkB/YihY/UPF0761 family membrane protein
MIPNPKDQEFLQKRARIAEHWKIIGVMLFLMLGAVVIFLILKSPYLANPMRVAMMLKDQGIDEEVMRVSTLLLPVVVLILFSMVGVFILFAYLLFSIERRYHRIIGSMRHEDANPKELVEG